MLRGRSPPQQRPVSPANTTFSGISSYRSDSYRAKDQRPPIVPPIDARAIAKVHYEELTQFLSNHLTKENQGSRTTAREKLTKLTMQQFQELSTDVYDELVRRNNNSSRNEVPFLPVREEFHPKRNQARQKLATLPTPRFKDLSSDVYYELGRRFPEFKVDLLPPTPASPPSAYDGESSPMSSVPPPPIPPPPGGPPQDRRSNATDKQDTFSTLYGNGTGAHPGRQPSQDLGHNRASEREPMRRGRPSFDSTANTLSFSSSASTTRKPSRSERDWDRERDMAVPTSVKPGMVIPNKSTMAEEDPIEVPFGPGSTEDGSSGMPGSPPPPPTTGIQHRRGLSIRDRDQREREQRERDEMEKEKDLDSESEFARSPRTGGGVGGNGNGDPGSATSPGPTSGLSGLSARLVNMGAFAEDSDNNSPHPGNNTAPTTKNGNTDESHSGSLYGRSSVASDRSGPNGPPSSLSRSGSKINREREKEWEANKEEMKRDYEFKLATLQKKSMAGEERVKTLEDELGLLKERAEDLGGTIRSLQRELEEMKTLRANDRHSHEKELVSWKERYERLEEQHAQSRGGEDPEIAAELRREFDGLLGELQELQSRYDDLLTVKEDGEDALHRAEEEAKDWKRRYDSAKVELRSYRTTSSYFLPQLQNSGSNGGIEEGLPRIRYTSDGGVLDTQLTDFQSSIDTLLTIGRSPTPAKVLAAMRTVVDTVSAILNNPRPQFNADSSAAALNERLEDTLSNLVIAARNHAQSYGLSPVSLLDAAASHVSETVLELARYVGVRRGDRRDDDDFVGGGGPPGGGGGSMIMSPSVPTPIRAPTKGWSTGTSEGGRIPPRNPGSISSSFRDRERDFHSHSGSTTGSSVTKAQQVFGHQRNPPSTSDPSSSAGSSSSPIFDTPLTTSSVGGGESGTTEEAGEDGWAELKPYLEAQCESLVYAIQSVLSSVRATNPAPASLDEHLTQIITIVSSIVAVCNDSVPFEGRAILRELSEHCDHLSEVQASMGRNTTVAPSKETRQIVAKSSFAVANAVKSLMKL